MDAGTFAPPARTLRHSKLALGVLLLSLAAQAAPDRAPVTVFAAASLTDALQEVARAYTATSGGTVRFSFAASSMLARQIESGAAADVFFSADEDWMDYLVRRDLVDPATRHSLLGNRLVLVAPADSTVRLTIEPHFPLLAALQGGRLATGDPDTVPVGRYARASLTSLGVWNDVAGRLVAADNVRGALAFVARGEAPLGIVYETDARIDSKVRIVGIFPEGSHAPIVYPVALTKGAAPAAGQFIEFLRGPVAQATFERYGFVVLH